MTPLKTDIKKQKAQNVSQGRRYAAICKCPLNQRNKNIKKKKKVFIPIEGKLNPIKCPFTPNHLHEAKQHYIPYPSTMLSPKHSFQTKKQIIHPHWHNTFETKWLKYFWPQITFNRATEIQIYLSWPNQLYEISISMNEKKYHRMWLHK